MVFIYLRYLVRNLFGIGIQLIIVYRKVDYCIRIRKEVNNEDLSRWRPG